MDFKNLKIGYVPYSPDLSQPADRRRFLHFAGVNKVPFEIADISKRYDIILLPAPANLSRWLLYKKKYPETKFIFEMVDSLIFSSGIFNTIFKGLGRFILRKEKVLYFNHKKLIIKWLKIADVVMCSSNELKNNIKKVNKNVILSLDYLENEYTSLKNDFSINGKMKLVWEGQGTVLPHFLYFKKVLEKINSFCELHIITTGTYSLYGKFMKKDVYEILDQLPIKTIFHQWDIHTKDKILSHCDCGFIPLNRKNLFGWHKPCNKLISFWFTGLPTVVSDTPAYKELMKDAKDNLYCSSIHEFVSKLRLIKNMLPEERQELSKKNLAYVKEHYSDKVLDSVWQQVFDNLCIN